MKVDKKGRFKPKSRRKIGKKSSNIIVEHNYADILGICKCTTQNCPIFSHRKQTNGELESWHGRRVIELDVLLKNLQYCQHCKLGPVPLTYDNVVGELQKGLSGYLHVMCLNVECGAVNKVPYGKTHHMKKKGMPCFDINTRLGIAMVDTLGGAVRVNNLLSALDLKVINPNNLKSMEGRAGEVIEAFANNSTQKAAEEAYKKEMLDIAEQETQESKQILQDAGGIEDLGVWLLPDASPDVKNQFDSALTNDSLTDDEIQELPAKDILSIGVVPDSANRSSELSPKTPVNSSRPSLSAKRYRKKNFLSSKFGSRVKLAEKFPCRTRQGMSCAVDTAWHKRGFDSLTGHTFFMSKSKYGKKVLKTVVKHRRCGVCFWWKRHRPGQIIRQHQCVLNHYGSARSMEATSGVQGVQDLMKAGVQVEYLEGDGDNTLIAKLKKDLNINMKKRFDRNHIVKNVGKSLWALHYDKTVKLSKNVITHIEKCLKYTYAKNQGDKADMEKNLIALIPHQFDDHSKCEGRFCGYCRKQDEVYRHRSLPYKCPLKDPVLRNKLQEVFDPLILSVDQLIDLGSSQQCEHANREVTLRNPKNIHYGNTKAVDYHVHATAAFVNEGRHYIPKVLLELLQSSPFVLLDLVNCYIFGRAV